MSISLVIELFCAYRRSLHHSVDQCAWPTGNLGSRRAVRTEVPADGVDSPCLMVFAQFRPVFSHCLVGCGRSSLPGVGCWVASAFINAVVVLPRRCCWPCSGTGSTHAQRQQPVVRQLVAVEQPLVRLVHYWRSARKILRQSTQIVSTCSRMCSPPNASLLDILLPDLASSIPILLRNGILFVHRYTPRHPNLCII